MFQSRCPSAVVPPVVGAAPWSFIPVPVCFAAKWRVRPCHKWRDVIGKDWRINIKMVKLCEKLLMTGLETGWIVDHLQQLCSITAMLHRYSAQPLAPDAFWVRHGVGLCRSNLITAVKKPSYIIYSILSARAGWLDAFKSILVAE